MTGRGSEITLDMVYLDHLRWRDMSGERRWDVATIERVFQDFLRTAFFFWWRKWGTEKERDQARTLMRVVQHEHLIRQEYRSADKGKTAMKGLFAAIDKLQVLADKYGVRND